MVKVRHGLMWHLEGMWLVIHANLDYLWHLIRGHKIRYFEDPDLWIGHLGFINCTDCPDCEGSSLCIWGHHWNWLYRLCQFICSKHGHTFARPWMKATPGKFDENGDQVFDTPTDDWHCDRCMATMEAPQ